MEKPLNESDEGLEQEESNEEVNVELKWDSVLEETFDKVKEFLDFESAEAVEVPQEKLTALLGRKSNAPAFYNSTSIICLDMGDFDTLKLKFPKMPEFARITQMEWDIFAFIGT